MKHIVVTIILALSIFTSFSQYGDAYHAPNTLQLSLDRQRRMTAADNAHYDNMRSSNKTSSSSPISGNYNAYGWADYSGIRRQEEAGRRNQARIDEYNAKVNKLEGLIKARGLKREPKYRTQLIKATREAGFDEFMVVKLYGLNEKQYEEMLVEQMLAKNGAYSGGTKLNCQDDCVETLTAYNGDVYIGNTLNGKPHGKGRYKTKATNIEVDGFFANGQMNGLATAKGEKYTATGNFNMGKQVGVHTIITQEEDNIIGTYKINFDNFDDCSYTATDGMVYKGKMDVAYNFIKGEIVYGSGIKFNGYFKDNEPYRGTWIKEHRIMVGEFASAGDGTLYLKYGYLDNQKSKIIYQGNFGPGMKKTGFVNQTSNDGTVTEFYYSAPDVEEYVCTYFTGGNRLYLKANTDGKEYVGVYNKKEDGVYNSYAVTYSKKDGIVNMAASETELIKKASIYAKEAIQKTKKGQEEYNSALKNVEEFFKDDVDTKESNKKAVESEKSLKASTKAVAANEVDKKNDSKSNASTSNNTQKEINKESENLKKSKNNTISKNPQLEQVKPSVIAKKEAVSQLSSENDGAPNKNLNYSKSSLKKLNAYLENFSDGYYGYFEVLDGELFMRLKSGNYFKAAIKNLDKAYVVDENKKIAIKCINGESWSNSIYPSLTDHIVMYQSTNFNSSEFIQLINDFLDAYKDKKL